MVNRIQFCYASSATRLRGTLAIQIVEWKYLGRSFIKECLKSCKELQVDLVCRGIQPIECGHSCNSQLEKRVCMVCKDSSSHYCLSGVFISLGYYKRVSPMQVEISPSMNSGSRGISKIPNQQLFSELQTLAQYSSSSTSSGLSSTAKPAATPPSSESAALVRKRWPTP